MTVLNHCLRGLDKLSIKRSFDWEALDSVVEKYKHNYVGFDAKKIVQNKKNILISDNNKNFGLFEFEKPGVYYGHYLFSTRGHENTLKTARELLGYFLTNYPVKIVLGLTPIEHQGALALNEKLGLQIKEVVQTEAGPHFFVFLKKENFKYE